VLHTSLVLLLHVPPAVLDLDPNRLRELLTAWSTEWAGKNWKT
jgi:hypothetical protein